MTTYRTPGVYVEEIVKFPPSVAQVETAIPAFIGYTEKATKKVKGDLKMVPMRITSMLEYETYFGGAQNEDGIQVTVSGDDIEVEAPVSRSPFLMYYSLQMYFANGGGPCYITSVGRYGSASLLDASDSAESTVSLTLLTDGLDKIEEEDEPTLLLFPDATSLSDSDFNEIYKAALTQCNKLQDRFTIIDTYSDKEYGLGSTDPIDAIRAGMNQEKDYLKYGAVYFPYLETILDYAYDEANVDIQGLSDSLSIVVQSVIDGIDLDELETLLDELVAVKLDIDAAAAADAMDYQSDIILKVEKVIAYLETHKNAINDLISKSEDANEASLAASIAAMTAWMDLTPGGLEEILADLHAKVYKLNQDTTKTQLLGSLTTNAKNVYGLLGLAGNEADTTLASIYTSLDGQKTADELFDLKTDIDALGVVTVPTLADLKDTDNQLYNRVKAEIGLLPIILPPSSSMAGVYARVDEDRGVWKAPANVGLNYVTKPTVNISNDVQDDLNVHVAAGKSVNAIRTFTGKGVLVWGARTLAGNDNEWRYVSVRRFFNMAEESIKKATEQFVFEPNDKNTWVRVKAMIDNFLTQQWKAGALAGPAPDKAFYVNVGLGETMTAEDILNGYMIVEIGMAVVRPAEFIVLKFSHKMQEA